MVLLNGLVVARPTRTTRLVSRRSTKCINISSGLAMLPITVRSRLLSIVSNALLISILSTWFFHSCLRASALVHRCIQTTSAVLHPRRTPDCVGPMCGSTAGGILFRMTMKSAFLMVFRRTIGLRLVTGPLGFPGFASVAKMPTPITCEAFLLVSIAVLMMFVIKGDRYLAPYFKSSACNPTRPAAL